jgi:hypothetical protein
MKFLLSILVILFVVVPASWAQDAQNITTIDTLRVRVGPGQEHFVIASLPPRTAVIAEARNDGGEWLLVHTPDNALRGWVARRFLDFNDTLDPMSLPVSSEIIPSQQADTFNLLQTLPITAQPTARSVSIYQQGQAMGNIANRFTVVGDCQSIPNFFLGNFDRGYYTLGDTYAPLQSTIDYFNGSFYRERPTVYSGYTIYAVLDPLWSDPAICNNGENPMECEYRLYQPAFALVTMEVWHGEPEQYEQALYQVLDFWISRGVVPIMATKADNREGQHDINLRLARISQEYDLPLWNFYRTTNSLPNSGLVDGFHLTFAPDDFTDVNDLTNFAWPRRNLTALQSLDNVWRGVTGQPLHNWEAVALPGG